MGPTRFITRNTLHNFQFHHAVRQLLQRPANAACWCFAAGHEYRRILRRHDIHQSIGRADDCCGNVFMESCFGTIKTELELIDNSSRQTAVRGMTEYTHYYNNERRLSAHNYLIPAQFEPLCNRPK